MKGNVVRAQEIRGSMTQAEAGQDAWDPSVEAGLCWLWETIWIIAEVQKGTLSGFDWASGLIQFPCSETLGCCMETGLKEVGEQFEGLQSGPGKR